MPNEINPTDYPNDADYHEEHPQTENIVHRFERNSKNSSSRKTESDANHRIKPSLTVRILRVLWRRRKWRHMRRVESGPHWAEITTVCVTVGIFLATCIQARIYREQAQIMQDSLQQNERTIILGQGQLMVAARNTKFAEDTFRATRDAADTAQKALNADLRG